MHRRGIIAAIAGLTASTPIRAEARRHPRYRRPDGARCWHRSLVEVTFNGEPVIGTVFVTRTGATVAATNQNDDIILADDDICIRQRSR